MPQFMLVLRDNGSFPTDIGPDEIRSILGRYEAWSARIQGKGHKLRDGEGHVLVRKDGGVTVTDGPYAESREILGGYIVIEADDYAAAVRHCQDSPHLEYGSIEVRQVEF